MAATPTGAAPQEGKTASRSTADWAAIERAYRAGVLTNREIAKQHGISETAIRKRAKRESWDKDLTARVQEKVRSELVRTEVRTAEAANQERQIVEEAAATVVSLVREHRQDIKRLRATGSTLWQQLEAAIGSRDVLEELIADECTVAPDAPGYVKAAAEAQKKAMLKAVSLPSHVACLKDLANTMKALIPLEREAFGLESGAGAPPAAPADGLGAALTLQGIDAFAAKLRERHGVAE
jgi:predicted transcriptional regulator